MTKKQLGLFSALLLGVTIFTTEAMPAFAANNSEAQQEETVKVDESDVAETAKTNSESEVIVEAADTITIKEQPQTTTRSNKAQEEESVKLKESDVAETVKINPEFEGEFNVEVDDETSADLAVTITEQPQTTTSNNDAQQKETVKVDGSDVAETAKTNTNLEGDDTIMIDDKTAETKITTIK